MQKSLKIFVFPDAPIVHYPARLFPEATAEARGLPVVFVGADGLTHAVTKEVDAALLAHELIKVRLLDPEDKKALAAEVASAAHAVLCGLVGHVVIL